MQVEALLIAVISSAARYLPGRFGTVVSANSLTCIT